MVTKTRYRPFDPKAAPSPYGPEECQVCGEYHPTDNQWRLLPHDADGKPCPGVGLQCEVNW